MEIRKYTTPVIKKGKEVTFVPKGSSKAAEQAKNMWYVEYRFNGKQVRVKEGINRYNHDHLKKQYEADILLGKTKVHLANELYNPFDKSKYMEQTQKDFTTLADAINKFKEYHIEHQSRKKTIGTYMSKLNALSAEFPGKLVNDITTRDLETFVQQKIQAGIYGADSVKSAKRIFSTFFGVMIKLGYCQSNPKNGFDSKIRSFKEREDKHSPYTDSDLKKIFEYLDEHDKYTAFFCRMVYYTCIRPGEIRGLRVKDIDLTAGKITIPASVKKSTYNNDSQSVDIDINFRKELEKLDLSQYPLDYFLAGSTVNIIGKTQVGVNTPYEKLMTALKKINEQELKENSNLRAEDMIINKNYDLYGFKATSNIKKYNQGWTLAQIMKANRHGSVSMTEIYLKKLGAFTDTKHLEVPAI